MKKTVTLKCVVEINEKRERQPEKYIVDIEVQDEFGVHHEQFDDYEDDFLDAMQGFVNRI